VVETPQISAVSSDKTVNKYSPAQQFYENRELSVLVGVRCPDSLDGLQRLACCKYATDESN
jgi:hypothetical protein